MSFVPDLIEPVVGWRTWVVVADGCDGVRLRSVVHGTVWPIRQPLAAACLDKQRVPSTPPLHPGDEPPDASCSCGIYGEADLDRALSYHDGHWFLASQAAHGVVGLVSLWGKVVECERGWRASRGYPARLFVPMHMRDGTLCAKAPEIALSLTEYGVPVELVEGRTHNEFLAAVQTAVSPAFRRAA